MAVGDFVNVPYKDYSSERPKDDVKKQLQELLRLTGMSEHEWILYYERFQCMSAYEFLQERLKDSSVHYDLARSF